MKSAIIDSWLNIRASYWFLPLLMAVGATAASVVLVQLDSMLGVPQLPRLDWLYANQPDGAQALLSTIAGSMITIASVTFSMTLLAVSHATGQIGHGLLSEFMRDRGNQITLGTFVATFLYCLMVLRTVHGGADGESDVTAFVPHLAVLGGLVLAILSVSVLIYFLHHVFQSINVSNVVARIGEELLTRVSMLHPERLEKGQRAEAVSSDARLPQQFDAESRCVPMAAGSGYLRVVDEEGLMTLAQQHDVVLQVRPRPGDFLFDGQPLMRVWPRERADDELVRALCGAFSWGPERTPEQDVLLPAQRLLEILGKALSPGINNQYTALLCIDQLERGLEAMLSRRISDSHRVDSDDRLRVIAAPITHELFVRAVCEPLAQFIRGDWIATSRVLRSLGRLMQTERLHASRSLLLAQANAIYEDAQRSAMPEMLKQSLEKTWGECLSTR